MEAARPAVKTWSVLEAVVSLLSIMMLILGQRWDVAETVDSE